MSSPTPFSSGKIRLGFTLVELLVTIAIIGILVGMLLPGVQMVREAGRRAHCQSNLKNLGLALANYESAHRYFPHGAAFKTQHSWGSASLPFLEQGALYDSIDFRKIWNHASNQDAARTQLPIFHCPTSDKYYNGKTDYCGISGSWRSANPIPGEMNGMLYPVYSTRARKVTFSSIVDGASHTIIVSEGAEVHENNDGYWASGLNCFSHEDDRVNAAHRPANEIVSDHVGGANAVFCDGGVRFIGDQVDLYVVAAACTRNGAELMTEY